MVYNTTIYCDAYGSDVNQAECEHCSIKNDCKKIKLKISPEIQCTIL